MKLQAGQWYAKGTLEVRIQHIKDGKATIAAWDKPKPNDPAHVMEAVPVKVARRLLKGFTQIHKQVDIKINRRTQK